MSIISALLSTSFDQLTSALKISILSSIKWSQLHGTIKYYVMHLA